MTWSQQESPKSAFTLAALISEIYYSKINKLTTDVIRGTNLRTICKVKHGQQGYIKAVTQFQGE